MRWFTIGAGGLTSKLIQEVFQNRQRRWEKGIVRVHLDGAQSELKQWFLGPKIVALPPINLSARRGNAQVVWYAVYAKQYLLGAPIYPSQQCNKEVQTVYFGGAKTFHISLIVENIFLLDLRFNPHRNNIEIGSASNLALWESCSLLLFYLFSTFSQFCTKYPFWEGYFGG